MVVLISAAEGSLFGSLRALYSKPLRALFKSVKDAEISLTQLFLGQGDSYVTFCRSK